MKTKNLFRLGALCLALALISTALLSGTFAKYATELAGQDTALVARWNFGATDGATPLGTAATTELDLFGHAYNTGINQLSGETPIIAPGVQGDFDLDVSYLADVDATLDITIAKTAESVDVPMEYALTSDFAGATEDLAELKTAVLTKLGETTDDAFAYDAGTLTITKSAVGATDASEATVKVYWRWKFDGVDADDTVLGEASAAAGVTRTSYGLIVTFTATQVVPTTAP